MSSGTGTSQQLGRKPRPELLSRCAYSVWFLGVYWSLVGHQIIGPEVSSLLLHKAQSILRTLLAALLVLSVWPLVLGAPLDIPERRRRRFIAGVTGLSQLILVLEAMAWRFPALGVLLLSVFFIGAGGLLFFGVHVGSTRRASKGRQAS